MSYLLTQAFKLFVRFMNLWRPKRRNGALSASIGISIASALSCVVRRLSRVLSIDDRQLLINTILDGEH